MATGGILTAVAPSVSSVLSLGSMAGIALSVSRLPHSPLQNIWTWPLWVCLGPLGGVIQDVVWDVRAPLG